jgi:hypothetical protein
MRLLATYALVRIDHYSGRVGTAQPGMADLLPQSHQHNRNHGSQPISTDFRNKICQKRPFTQGPIVRSAHFSLSSGRRGAIADRRSMRCRTRRRFSQWNKRTPVFGGH